MHRIIKNTILKYIPNKFSIEDNINIKRIFNINDCPVKKGYVVYLCEREIRVKDNFALQLSVQKSEELNLPLKIIVYSKKYEYALKQKFIENQIYQVKKIFEKNNFDFQIVNQCPIEILQKIEIGMLIIDFNPILDRSYLKGFVCKILEVDGHNIIPARFVSNKKEYSAATFRPKIYYGIYPFLTEFFNITNEKIEADYVLDDFIKNKLQYYKEFKNNPSNNVLSGLSKYLNLGFISSQRAAIEVIRSDVPSDNKEAFLEELIVRKELADNFCLYTKNFKGLSSVSDWAKISLESHKFDIRPYVYSYYELEKAKTNDKLWNATQNQLINEGKIHGYLRMYWAKKISEWSKTPEEAIQNAICLNDKYAFDAPAPNGYVGILWAIGGLHDRAFVDYPVTGKIRRMSYDSIKRKFDLSKYINQYI